MFDLRDYSTVLLDIDGVLCQGERLLPGARELIAFFESTQTRYACVTNSAALTPRQRSAKLERMGLRIDPSLIVTSALAVRHYLDIHIPAGSGVFPLGMEGLQEALLADHKFVADLMRPQVVVASHDEYMSYDKCRRATQAIQAGALFIATNPDVLVPSEEGLVPEAGALTAYLEAASGVQARVIGKPKPDMFHLAIERLGTNGATLMIGDRPDTDVAGAQAAGIAAALVMTGVTGTDDLRALTHQPDAIFANLPSMLAAWERS